MRAVVTGAGSRLGAAMAEALAQSGYDVVLHFASNGDGAAQTAARIAEHGQRAVPMQADLLSLSDCDAVIPRAADALGGPISVLVNNASIFEHDDVHTATHESWDRHIGSNLRAPFILSQAFAAQAPEAASDGEPLASGLIVNMIDQRVRKLTPEFTTYTLAKSGLWTLTRTLAQALAPAIRVNAIGPGPTLRGARQSEEHFAAQRAATILKRGADPDDITDALRYLLGAKAVTGQLICVDGGQHLAWETPDVLGVE
ncbi:MAG: SDR family oxidoreductase [Pseudomonadota bacterium]